MNRLRQFFKENDVRVGEGKDFTVSPPVYYASLTNAFYYYFLTFRDKKLSYPLLADPLSWTRKMLTFELTGSNDNIIFAILSFHRFFELLLKDILKRINPFLAVRIPERPEQLFHFLDDNLPSEEIKSIEFAESLKRFRHAFKHFDRTSPNYLDVLSHYEFLNDRANIEMLDVLSEWKNRIMHNGATFPNLLAFEFLITQGILPIVSQVIEAESKFTRGYVPPYLKTPTKIDILEEILKIKFSFNDSENRNGEIGLQLVKIGQKKVFPSKSSEWHWRSSRMENTFKQFNNAFVVVKFRL